MNFKDIIKLADIFTIANFSLGMLSIIYTIKGDYSVASWLIIAAVVMDFLDGRIARATGSANEFGKELDSLSDIVSFGIAPAILGFGLGLDSWLAIVVLIYFSVCGVLRLARFNVLKRKEFMGVPITMNGLLFPLLYFVFHSFNNYMLIAYFIMGLLMISSIRIKKF